MPQDYDSPAPLKQLLQEKNQRILSSEVMSSTNINNNNNNNNNNISPNNHEVTTMNAEDETLSVTSIATMSLTPPEQHHHPSLPYLLVSSTFTQGDKVVENHISSMMRRTASQPSFSNLHVQQQQQQAKSWMRSGQTIVEEAEPTSNHKITTNCRNGPVPAASNHSLSILRGMDGSLSPQAKILNGKQTELSSQQCAAAAADSNPHVEYDDAGEPIFVDETMVQTLQQQQSQLLRLEKETQERLEQQKQEDDEEEESENAIMLESSSSHDDNDDNERRHRRPSFFPFIGGGGGTTSNSRDCSATTTSIRIHSSVSQNSMSGLSLNQLGLEDTLPLLDPATDMDINTTGSVGTAKIPPTVEMESLEDPGDAFLRTNSLLNLHHGRQPSTIVEECMVLPQSSSDKTNVVTTTASATSRNYHGIASVLNSNYTNINLDNNDDHHHHPLLLIPPKPPQQDPAKNPLLFTPHYRAVRILGWISRNFFLLSEYHGNDGAATWIAFWGLLNITCANYVLTPIRDAIALTQVDQMPQLTLLSTVLALISSVPIGWLFEAPDPNRRRLWKRMGLTRGETQGTSLALLYRIFAMVLVLYAIAFELLDENKSDDELSTASNQPHSARLLFGVLDLVKFKASVTQVIYICFFLMVHLMKLHCLSLVWGVTTEAMEYEEVARKQYERQQTLAKNQGEAPPPKDRESGSSSKMRLKRLSLVGFGGTMGGILGSLLASSMAKTLRLSGLLVFASLLLEVSAELSIELGCIMQKHWVGQQHLFQSANDLTSLDPSMRRSTSLGSMKRISSGNSLNRIKSATELNHKGISPSTSSGNLSTTGGKLPSAAQSSASDDTFMQRMLRGVTTILRSRLLMSIFTYNALYASTNVLLSFQRAHLVANRDSSTGVQGDTAFLANINMASSFATFALQATGTGVFVANLFGLRGTLALMPTVRFLGVAALAWWHRYSGGRPPNLFIFLIVDEWCKVMNLAIAKPVRESLWRGLSNEARYEAKPLSDTLSNRWGGGSAAFLVSSVDKMLDVMRIDKDISGVRNIFGLTPTLFLCLVISAWWAAVSADLGQIRRNIDLELKKRQ